MWNPRRLTTLWAPAARYWDSFTVDIIPLWLRSDRNDVHFSWRYRFVLDSTWLSPTPFKKTRFVCSGRQVLTIPMFNFIQVHDVNKRWYRSLTLQSSVDKRFHCLNASIIFLLSTLRAILYNIFRPHMASYPQGSYLYRSCCIVTSV
jgi:hypothetical protein